MMREEQETVFRYDATRNVVSIWTADKVTARKMAKKGVSTLRTTATSGVETGWWYEVPYKAFRWSINLKPRSGGGFKKSHIAPTMENDK